VIHRKEGYVSMTWICIFESYLAWSLQIMKRPQPLSKWHQHFWFSDYCQDLCLMSPCRATRLKWNYAFVMESASLGSAAVLIVAILYLASPLLRTTGLFVRFLSPQESHSSGFL
jgi:hypothetical protein